MFRRAILVMLPALLLGCADAPPAFDAEAAATAVERFEAVIASGEPRIADLEAQISEAIESGATPPELEVLRDLLRERQGAVDVARSFVAAVKPRLEAVEAAGGNDAAEQLETVAALLDGVAAGAREHGGSTGETIAAIATSVSTILAIVAGFIARNRHAKASSLAGRIEVQRKRLTDSDRENIKVKRQRDEVIRAIEDAKATTGESHRIDFDDADAVERMKRQMSADTRAVVRDVRNEHIASRSS